MTRSPVKPKVLEEVLVKSRRRCSICFGLNRDTDLKSGQIAHLDHDSSNSSEDNLCFLCLAHHDEYDSKTSQRKGFTINEVKRFRAELHDSINKAFSIPVHFGSVTLPKDDPYAGEYIRVGSDEDSAEITVTPVPDSVEGKPRYYVTGYALYGLSREYGPNMGDIGFSAEMTESGALEYKDYTYEYPYSIKLFFAGGGLHVVEDHWIGVHGFNVTFNGVYRKVLS